MAKAQTPLAHLSQHWLKARLAMAEGDTLTQALSRVRAHERAAVQALLYATIRRRALTDRLIGELTQREPAPNVRALLELGLTCLVDESFSDYTVTNQLVEAVKRTDGPGASRFLNAVLRRFLREKAELLAAAQADETVRCNAPAWWIERVKRAAPESWERVFETTRKHPPLTVRLNPKKLSHEDFLAALRDRGLSAERTGQTAYILSTPVPVTDIPGFDEGAVSVQDAGTQLAAQWLPVKPGDRVLDACAAPGGKTAHLLEAHDCRVTALEISPVRAKRMQETLSRLKLAADVVVADASKPEKWFKGEPFDAILLDAPCSASGVTRRNPDVPWVRKPETVAELSIRQFELLEALWPLLKTGGHLLFVTCSIFPEEGPEPVKRFLARHADARTAPLPGNETGIMTLLPREAPWDGVNPEPGTHDGFFYALLRKGSVA